MSDNPNLLSEMKKELPAFLWLLLNRQLTTSKEGRMWFRTDLITTDALRKIINHNRNKAESEMLQIVAEIIDSEQLVEFNFCVVEMAKMLELRGLRSEHSHIRKIVQNSWELKPSPPKHYTCYRIIYDGTIEQSPKIDRCFTMSREKLLQFL